MASEQAKKPTLSEILVNKTSWLEEWISEKEKRLFMRLGMVGLWFYFLLIFAVSLTFAAWFHGTLTHASVIMALSLLTGGFFLPKLYNAVLIRFLKRDPLYNRGLLITSAIKQYNVHKAKFELWQKAVQFGNVDPDPEYAQNNEKYLGQVQKILLLAIFDLYKNSELARMQKECDAESDKVDASLSELVVQVEKPIEAPRVRVAVPRVRIEYEGALLEISQDLNGEKELTEKIKALGEKC